VKYALALLLLAVPAYGQDFDLTEMPEGYWFTAIEHDGASIVTFFGEEDGLFLFSFVSENGDNPTKVTMSQANRASQLVEFSNEQGGAVLTPHDCWPQKGRCEYLATYEDGISVKISSETYVENGVWFHRRFAEDETGWYEIERGCATIDEYGFPIDLYIEYGDGRIEWSTRETTQGQPDSRADFDALKAVCKNTEDLFS